MLASIKINSKYINTCTIYKEIIITMRWGVIDLKIINETEWI